MTDELKQAVRAAGQRAEVRAAVGRVYAELGRAVQSRRPVCEMSGRCCRFEAYGHRLYVTTIELGTFLYELKQLERPMKLLEAIAAWDGTGCPFQVAKLCGVHGIRPLGCRMFFCDPTSTPWQNEQYERFHGQIKQLHDELDVPYAYMEWREALRGEI